MIVNKKGFTLVELLGTIVILGILSTIAIVSMTKVLESSHKKYYDTQVKLLQSAGQTYFSDHKAELPTINFGIKKVGLDTLIDQGYINKIVDYNKEECYPNKSYVTVTRYGPSKYVYDAFLSCENRVVNSYKEGDSNNQTINLDYNPIDNSNGFLEKNTYYVRGTLTLNLKIAASSSGDNSGITGYSYTLLKDNKDYKTSEIIPYDTNSICTSNTGDKCTTISDTININAKDIKDGIYTLKITTYNLKGISKNETFSNKTIVIDKTKPKCSIVITDGDKGNLVDGNQWYKKGDKEKVSLKMTIKEKNKSKIRFDTTEYTQQFLGDTYKNASGELVKYQTNDTSSDGQVWYGQVEDKAGNSAKCTMKVFFDKTEPTCIINKKTSNGTVIGNNSWTKDDYTATRACADGQSGCDSKSLSNLSKNITTSANTVNNSSITSDDDSVYDKAGNKGSCGDIKAKLDKQGPECKVSGGSSDWTNGSRTITAKCDNDYSGIGCADNQTVEKEYNEELNITTAGAIGNGNGGSVKDKLGNISSCGANQTVKIEKTGPSWISNCNNNNNCNGFGITDAYNKKWFNNKNYEDSSKNGYRMEQFYNIPISGIKEIKRYRYDGQNWIYLDSADGVFTGYRQTGYYSAEQYQYIGFELVSNAGNPSIISYVLVAIDRTKPSISKGGKDNSNANYKYLSSIGSSVEKYVTCADGLSGIASFTTNGDGGSDQFHNYGFERSSDNTKLLRTSDYHYYTTSGKKNTGYKCIDEAGNEESSNLSAVFCICCSGTTLKYSSEKSSEGGYDCSGTDLGNMKCQASNYATKCN